MGLCWEIRDYDLRSEGTREIIPGSVSLVSNCAGPIAADRQYAVSPARSISTL
jgi:hypothetical protein